MNDSFERKLYIKEAAGHTAVKIMKIRLNMIDVRMHYKAKYKVEKSLMCPLCGEVSDTTEHLLECNTIGKYTEADLQNTKHVENCKEIIKIVNENQNLRNTHLVPEAVLAL